MPEDVKYEVYQLPLGNWAVVRLPRAHQAGDLLPRPSADTVFSSREEAVAHVDRLMAKKKPAKPRGNQDPALSAFEALQHVIDMTEGPQPKSKKPTRRAK